MLQKVKKEWAKKLWIDSQKLNQINPFGPGPNSVNHAISHLGYVQIDTISVIERCHHHILYTRIPHYKRSYLERAQSLDKTVFEYWTHALSYIPVQHFRHYMHRMKSIKTDPGTWYGQVSPADYRKVKRLLNKGPLTIRDIKDDVLKDKEHDWDSRKPSKRALQLGFNRGDFVVSSRSGMLKAYDLTTRHFSWSVKPKPSTDMDHKKYLIERSLHAQGIVSVESICYLNNAYKAGVLKCIEQMCKQNELQEVQIQNQEKMRYWVRPDDLERKVKNSTLTHILSPFDPLIIQRQRLKNFFDYEHVFEAYVTPSKRKFGYFTLPVLSEDRIVALLDLKMDRQNKMLLIKSWHWRPRCESKQLKKTIEAELNRFEKFQLASGV